MSFEERIFGWIDRTARWFQPIQAKKVETGTIRYVPGPEYLTFDPEGSTQRYALNGAARRKYPIIYTHPSVHRQAFLLMKGFTAESPR
jgi:hypothetical protein